MNKKSPFLSNDEKLISNDFGFVIFDKHPVTLGHSLIIPNRIYADYFESTSEEIVGFNEPSKRLFKKKIFARWLQYWMGYWQGCGSEYSAYTFTYYTEIFERFGE